MLKNEIVGYNNQLDLNTELKGVREKLEEVTEENRELSGKCRRLENSIEAKRR
jgi:predicted nuclease with TOPRIM domain